MAARLLLPALVLLIPFVVFLHHHSYNLAALEVWISLGGIIVFALVCSMAMMAGGRLTAALITAVLISFLVDIQFSHESWLNRETRLAIAVGTIGLCWMLREKFYLIAASVLGTSLIVSLLQLAVTPADSRLIVYPNPQADTLPRIVHLVLDEHIGIEGIPTDIDGGAALRQRISQFYLDHGFELYGGAFSHYLNTHHSVSNMVNFSDGSDYDALVALGTPKTILHNEYFKILAEKKYRLNVISPGEIDYCSDTPVPLDNCVDYHSSSLGAFSKLPLPVGQKFQVLVSVYFRQSGILSQVLGSQSGAIRSLFAKLGISWLDWTWALDLERTRMDSLNTLADIDVIWRNVLSLPKGTVLFAHLLLPHFPYVANGNCSIRSPAADFLWENNVLIPRPASNNTPTSREQRYRLYFQQVDCLYLKLGELLDRMRAAGMYDDSIIVVHGDHGSRIYSKSFTSEDQQALTKQDFLDGFNALFAVKIPGKKGTYDPSPLPLEQLLARSLVDANVAPRIGVATAQSKPFVYLAPRRGDSPRDRVPYPITE